MNERILKLADQARLAANAEYEKWTPTEDFSGVPHIRNIFMEKFAELIVQEYEKLLPETCPWADADKEGPMKGWHVQFVARKHFGVEK